MSKKHLWAASLADLDAMVTTIIESGSDQFVLNGSGFVLGSPAGKEILARMATHFMKQLTVNLGDRNFVFRFENSSGVPHLNGWFAFEILADNTEVRVGPDVGFKKPEDLTAEVKAIVERDAEAPIPAEGFGRAAEQAILDAAEPEEKPTGTSRGMGLLAGYDRKPGAWRSDPKVVAEPEEKQADDYPDEFDDRPDPFD